MSLFGEVMSGYAKRIRLENSLQLQKSALVRPMQIKMEVAHTFKAITDELKDAELKAEFDKIEIVVPA